MINSFWSVSVIAGIVEETATKNDLSQVFS